MAASFSISGEFGCCQATGHATFWRLEENKVFEVALAKHYADADRFERIASYLPNKTPSDIQKRLRDLEDDLRRIDEGCNEGASAQSAPAATSARSDDSAPNAKRPKTDVPANGDRRKGVPWTEEEHRLFLLGLAKFGKGDWRSIARNFVVSRTPTQVASHAQKYFIRLNSMNKKDKRRASIHDITSPTLPASVANPTPTTGLAPTAASGKTTSSVVQGATSSANTATSQPMAAAAAAAAAAFPAAAHVAAAAAAAAAAATSTTSVFAQLAMHGLAMQPVMQQAAAAAAAAGMMPQFASVAASAANAAGVPAPALPSAAQYMVQV
ncbi:hypothetical protein HXX76_000708 [Chlamydomonas incerta]|uniref:MYB transcription factor n=1 Tax=Chlamydomonas incerta TaxID=51695 RepID=A0A836B3C1_CHLIN|nr:hypothetical protein HXX76_000708 [Chlamydomonas incerta]|eukprot:KAG2446109.1 hypothetical protein HXX76_000708 [Chlamydomonas incerta]